MTDTPKNIHDLQLNLWLSKPPGERLFQFLKDNDDMLFALANVKEKLHIPFPGFDDTKRGLGKNSDE